MAIKGKGKTRSKPPARAPRPQPVQVRPPLFRRTWVLASLSFLLGIGIIWLAVWVTNGIRADDLESTQKAAQASGDKVVKQWAATVDGAVAQFQDQASPTQPPASGQIVAFTDLTTAVDSLAKGDKVKDAVATAKAAKDKADAAVATFSNVDLPTLIRDHGLDVTTTNYLLNSKARMVEGLQLYSQAADLVQKAAATDDPAAADELVAEASKLVPLAKEIFDEGYSDYTQAKAAVFTPQELAAAATGS
jgi:hypothetical protein